MVALSSEVFCVICSVPGNSSEAASEVLTAHVKTIGLTNNADDPHQLITVRRRNIWSDTNWVLGKPYANLTFPVKVIFVGEHAEDEGGPKREFFRLSLAAATSDPALFSGPCEHWAVQHNTTTLLRKEFHHVGNLISMSVIQGGLDLGALTMNLRLSLLGCWWSESWGFWHATWFYWKR